MNEETTLATVPDSSFTPQQIDIIRQQIAPDANNGQLAFFLEVCRATGLNPLLRQIHAVFRNAKEGDHWVKKMTIQTGIDGYRLLAARTGVLAGIDDAIYDTEDADHPNKASVTVYRLVAGTRVPFTATARWREYVQTNKDGSTSAMWQKMPFLLLGKCSEALALRKAFPAELSGVYTAEEMMQADNGLPEPPRTPQPRHATGNAQPVAEAIDADQTPRTASHKQSTQEMPVVDAMALTHASAEDQKRLVDALRKHGFTTQTAVEALLVNVCGREIAAAHLLTGTSDLSLSELARMHQRITATAQTAVGANGKAATRG